MENTEILPQCDFFSSELIIDPEEYPEVTIEESHINIETPSKLKESLYKADNLENDPYPKLSALLSQIPPEKVKPLENLIKELKTLAQIPHPLSPIEQYRRKLSQQNGNSEVPEEIVEAVWEDLPVEHKKKLQYEYQKAMEVYKPKRQAYFAKVNELRGALGLPALKYSKAVKLLKPFKIFKKEVITAIRKERPEARAKDLMPKIKEQWANMKRSDKRIYVLISRRENEKAIHEAKMKELDEEIEAIQKKRIANSYEL